MKISCCLGTHGDTPTVLDTLDSINKYCTDEILVLIDGASWQNWGKYLNLPIGDKIEGFYHGLPKSPYRNLTLGLFNLVTKYPESDWYLYCEYDVLFGSSEFKDYLEQANKRNVYCLGNDFRVYGNIHLPFLNDFMGVDIKNYYYLIGCCVFHKGEFLRKLLNIDFFERFLLATNDFSNGFFPDYEGYDIGEHLYPTLANIMGGRVEEISGYELQYESWRGNYKKYPIRWKPDININENFNDASIIHPIKSIKNPIRQFYRCKRMKDV